MSFAETLAPPASTEAMEKVRAALSPADFEREWARGRAMSYDEAIAAAIGSVTDGA